MTSTEPANAAPPLPDGLVVVVKRDCETCEMVAPLLATVAGSNTLTVYSQDDPSFPNDLAGVIDDTSLEFSWHHDIETVPTLIRVEEGAETSRIIGWSRSEWQSFCGIDDLGSALPEMRPGCGSMSVDPQYADELNVRFSGSSLSSRRIEFAALEDEMEAAFDRGWSDGLPVIPPTEARVLRMLEGTSRDPADTVAIIPPTLTEATVEQVAINAVMAGCKPEYFPVVLAAVETSCSDSFNMHGLLATTFFSGPILVVNGPIAGRIGMNSHGNAFGQGNRANLTIGRALQLVVRNLGGGRPGGVDMAALGSPGKLGFCFAEREHDSPFTPLSADFGLAPGTDAVTVFAGQGPTPIVDQMSRTPESLTRTFASMLLATGHPKLAFGWDALLVISPEHGRVYREAGWDKARLRSELEPLLTIETDRMLQGVDGMAEGLPAFLAGKQLPKFRPGGLQIAYAGGDAGMFSAILSGWVGGEKGSNPTSAAIGPWQ
ncbi:MAG: hypothetical protein ACI8TP_002021 [Acidimicrobiales bacterium]|jgi:hypothetical protein